MATAKERAADMKYALIAKRYGMKNSLRTAMEARDAGLGASLGFAMVEQESGNGANIFGHDPTIYAGAGRVTRAKYMAYKAMRGRTRMQGVGPLQLTYWTIQDAADRMGGCWVPKYNLRVGFRLLASLIKDNGKVTGIARYNGSGPAADNYSRSVRALEQKWHRRLYGR